MVGLVMHAGVPMVAALHYHLADQRASGRVPQGLFSPRNDPVNDARHRRVGILQITGLDVCVQPALAQAHERDEHTRQTAVKSAGGERRNLQSLNVLVERFQSQPTN